MNTAQVILDANAVLHFRRADEIDWPALTGADHANLIVVPVLMRELERKKATGSSALIRKRAARVIDYFANKMDEVDPIKLRGDCTLVFRDAEPLIDFSANRLSMTVDDDHYIASALEVAQETDDPTYIASADGGLKLKLRARAVSIIRPPESYRLEDEVDAETKELRAAKAELEKLKNARPKLSVGFNDGSRKLEISIPDLIVPDLKSLHQIMQDNPLKDAPDEAKTIEAFPRRADLINFSVSTTEARIERDNKRLREYYESYQSYLDETEDWLAQLCLVEWIKFRIDNCGGAAASNISVAVDAPEGTLWVDDSDLPDRPREPELSGSSIFDRIIPLAHSGILRPPQDGDVYVQESGSKITAKCGRINPGCGIVLEQAVLRFRDRSMVGRGSSFRAWLSYTEGEPVEFQLPFSVISSGTIDRRASE
jgi:hypothetical protein